MWPFNATESLPSQRLVKGLDEDSWNAYRYGSHASQIVNPQALQVSCLRPAHLCNRAVIVGSQQAFATIQATSRLKHPTLADWQYWKLDILRWYRYEAALTIVKRLRLVGYNVTVKMLRDRLRDWGANTKTRRSSIDIDPLPVPSMAIETAPVDFARRNLLKEMDQWYDTAFRRDERTAECHSPDTYLLCQFTKIAPAAIARDSPVAWASLQRLANRIAGTDWSLLTPIGLLLLSQQTARIAHEQILSPFVKIWLDVLTRDLHQTHPMVLLLNYLIIHRDEPDIWHELCAMYERKVVMYEEPRKREETIAEAKYWLAHVCLIIGQESQAEEILSRYVALANCTKRCRISHSRPCKIDALLGRSSFYRGCYDKAALYFRRARDFGPGEDVAWTKINAESWNARHLPTDQMHEASQILAKLSEQLHATIRDLAPKNDIERIRLSDGLKYLSEMLEGYPDLQKTIKI